MNLKIASAECMRNLSERNKPVVLQSELDKIQELINIAAAKAEGKAAVAIDAIALFESGLGKLCDVTIAVTADDELRVKRIMIRDQISEEYARLRIQAQKPSAWFEERCTHVLRNDGEDPVEFGTKARELFETMIN